MKPLPRPRKLRKPKPQLNKLNFESRLSAGLGQPQKESLYLIALSGGADSVAMLAGLAALREEVGFSLHCIHVEHGLRPSLESRGDARAVLKLSKKLDVPCRAVYIPPGKIESYARSGGHGIEAAARFFRYRILHRERRRVKADYILTAHTRDDVLENILMRVLRGSGPAGLAPMPKTKGCLLRPLLDLGRQDILDYINQKGLSYRIDSTNTDITFMRNKVRLRLIPLMDELFPSWRTTLFALAETQSLAADFLSDEAGKRLVWERLNGAGSEPCLRISEEHFFKAPLILREEAVFQGLGILSGTGNRTGSGFMHEQRPLPRRAALRRAATKGDASALGPLQLQRQKGFITMKLNKIKAGERGFSLLIKEPGLYTLNKRVWGGSGNHDLNIRVGPSGECEISDEHSIGCLFSVKLPVFFRSPMEGDRILLGGHRRSFSSIMNESSKSALVLVVQDVDGISAFIALDDKGSLMVNSRDKEK